MVTCIKKATLNFKSLEKPENVQCLACGCGTSGDGLMAMVVLHRWLDSIILEVFPDQTIL